MSAAPRTAGAPVSILQLLIRNPDVRRIWLAQIVSETGDWLTRIAVTDHIAGGDKRAALGIAVIQALMVLPFVVLSPFAGAVADKYPRRTVILTVEFVSAALVLLYLPLLKAEVSPLTTILMGAVVFGHIGLASFFEASRTALVSAVCREGEIEPAMALSQVTWSVCLALGSALGGFLLMQCGAATAVIVDAASFLLGAMLLFPMRGGRAAAAAHEESSSFFEGVRYLIAHPTAGVLVLPKFMLLFVGMSDLTFALLGPREYGVSVAESMSSYFAAIGIGTFAGPPIAIYFTRGRPAAQRTAIGVAFLLESAIFSGTLFSTSLWGATAFAGAATACGAVIWSTSMALLQRGTPDRISGRAVAFDFALATLAMTVSLVTAGALVDYAGFTPRRLLAVTTCMYALGGVAWFAILHMLRGRAWDGDVGRPA